MVRKKERRNELVIQSMIAKLRELRNVRDMSQKQVFNDTEVNIGRIESGRGNISISTLADLCTYYNISLRDFFDLIETDRSPEKIDPQT